jgi:hypothetical protein
MPLTAALWLLASVAELLKLAFLTAIPSFALALAAGKLHSQISRRFSLSWAKATLISTYLILTLLIIFLYSLPIYLGWVESPLSGQPVPPELQLTVADAAIGLLFAALKVVLAALAYTLLLLPFIFFATYVLERLKGRRLPATAKRFAAVFLSALLAWVVLLFVFPFAWGGLIYLLYWI